MISYRILEIGEVIIVNDEYYDDDKKQWIKTCLGIGNQAPDPRYTSHRIYRRVICLNNKTS